VYSKFSPLKNINKYTLENGLTIFLKSDHRIPTVSIQLWVNAGSVDETEQENGISHFLEHMIFKGTKKYTATEITHIIESYGGIINAATSKEYTEFYVDISKTGFNDALDIIADVACNSTFPDDELERERLVVLEEIKRSNDNPERLLYDNFINQLFTVTPYKWTIIGTSKSVSELTKDKLISYYREKYCARNMILVIVGDIDIESTKNLIDKKFSNIYPGQKNIRNNLIEPINPVSSRKIESFVQQDYILCGFLGPELDSEDQYSGDILSIILGSGLSSRLYRKLREEKQIVYSIGCGFSSQQGTGYFYISALYDPDKTDSVIKEIKIEIEKILNEGISKQELIRAKEIINSQWYFSQETFHQQASLIGYWSIIDRLNILENYLNKINKVTVKDVINFIKKYYIGLTTTIITPEKNK
jgi:predicted Zn-dependent peptidase